jgi:hypothetical protein
LRKFMETSRLLITVVVPLEEEWEVRRRRRR